MFRKLNLTKDDKLGLGVSLGVNIALLVFSLLFTINSGQQQRPSYIEVEFGEFSTGKLAEFAQEKNEEVAQRPNPSETQPEQPSEEVPEPEEAPKVIENEDTKAADLPDQLEEVIEEIVRTPVTEKIDPARQEADNQIEQVEIPPMAAAAETVEEGAEESGDVDGARGDVTADQGIGTDENKTSPYELKWEGDLDRTPMVQPLPQNTANTEAVISVRFEVMPDGSVGSIIPRIRMHPELEREVISTLRTWRFSRLPGSAPQQSQWGTITFRFVFN